MRTLKWLGRLIVFALTGTVIGFSVYYAAKVGKQSFPGANGVGGGGWMFAAPPQWFPSPILAQGFALVFLGWIAAEVINRVIAQAGGGGQVRDRGSYWGIIAALLVCLSMDYAARFMHLGILIGAAQIFGVILMLLGIATREWAIAVLGRHFQLKVTIQNEHHLVTRGPYRWVRHPAYTGSILTLIGVALTLGTWVGGLLTVIICLLTYSYRVRVEEQALVTALGNTYRDYMRRTWRFFPGW
jgi:protein-S-isoprenylcysteine O-methyltransferase Ste14